MPQQPDVAPNWPTNEQADAAWLAQDIERLDAEREIRETVEDWQIRFGRMAFPAGDVLDLLEGILYSVRQTNAPSRKAKRKLSPATRKRIMERDAYRCVFCGDHHDLSIDHIIPESRGGSDEDNNLQTLCMSCNIKKGTT